MRAGHLLELHLLIYEATPAGHRRLPEPVCTRECLTRIAILLPIVRNRALLIGELW